MHEISHRGKYHGYKILNAFNPNPRHNAISDGWGELCKDWRDT